MDADTNTDTSTDTNTDKIQIQIQTQIQIQVQIQILIQILQVKEEEVRTTMERGKKIRMKYKWFCRWSPEKKRNFKAKKKVRNILDDILDTLPLADDKTVTAKAAGANNEANEVCTIITYTKISFPK